jgi:chaperonin GroES
MTVRLLHDRVLIKRIEEQETVKGGIIIPDTAKEKSQEGEVICVGTGKTLENGSVVPLEVKEGDRILFLESIPEPKSSCRIRTTSSYAKTRLWAS